MQVKKNTYMLLSISFQLLEREWKIRMKFGNKKSLVRGCKCALLDQREARHVREKEGGRTGSHEGLREIIVCGDSITVATEQKGAWRK